MKMKIQPKLILAIDYVLILAIDISMRDYKKELDGHLEDTPAQLLSCPGKSIFSAAEVQQEKIEPEDELQVRERGNQWWFGECKKDSGRDSVRRDAVHRCTAQRVT